MPRYYKDRIGSKVDADLKRSHGEVVAPLKAFVSHVVTDADHGVRDHGGPRAACALAWIEAWAKGDAWLGDMGSKQAEYQRKWDLAGIALAYLKLRPYAPVDQRAMIEPWLLQFADKAATFQLAPERKRNNHRYWLGLALAATSLATDSPRLWDDARRIMQDAAADIRLDGSLPLELERGERALHYHAFAVTPLVVLAELAARRGENWFAFSNDALHRLVARTASGLVNPTAFGMVAHAEQEPRPGLGAGWLWLYQHRFPNRLAGPPPDVPRKHRWLGGDVSLLPGALP
ncbi:MAG: alginate lyase family protein [Hyphomicrobiaceae bacterium]